MKDSCIFTFRRRKTTHRPFTFARNFETEGTTSAAQNQVIEQVWSFCVFRLLVLDSSQI